MFGDLSFLPAKLQKQLLVVTIVDASESMVENGNIDKVNEAMREVAPQLVAAEWDNNVEILFAPLVFNNGARWVGLSADAGPSRPEKFVWEDVTAEGGSDLASAYDLLASKLTTKEKGGWMDGRRGLRPIIFLISNGNVNPGWEESFNDLGAKGWFIYSIKYAIAVEGASMPVLEKFTWTRETIYDIETLRTNLADLVKVIVLTVSAAVSDVGAAFNTTTLPEGDAEEAEKKKIMDMVDEVMSNSDDDDFFGDFFDSDPVCHSKTVRVESDDIYESCSPCFDSDPVATSAAVSADSDDACESGVLSFDSDPIARSVAVRPPLADDNIFISYGRKDDEELQRQINEAISRAVDDDYWGDDSFLVSTDGESDNEISAEKRKEFSENPVEERSVYPPLGEHISACVGCGSPVADWFIQCPYCRTPVKPQMPGRVYLSRVNFSAVVPKRFLKGEYAMIDITVYEEKFRHIVDNAVAQADTEVREISASPRDVERNTDIRITLSSPDIELEDCDETQTWRGDYLKYYFTVQIPATYAKKQASFTALVYFNGVIATKLKFIVNCTSELEQKLELMREDVLSAFVSYASQDRGDVATIIQGMKKARPDMDVFFDVESLRSGEMWEAALRREIEKRDILYLCWSHNAKASKWVENEWRYALENKGLDAIEPIPLVSPAECPPPDELKSKHFNDTALLYRKV